MEVTFQANSGKSWLKMEVRALLEDLPQKSTEVYCLTNIIIDYFFIIMV